MSKPLLVPLAPMLLVPALVGFALAGLSPAQADGRSGGMEGGGGTVVVCRTADGSVRSAETLDLFEGRAVYGLSYREDAADPVDQARALLRAAPIAGSGQYRPGWPLVRFEQVIANLIFLPDNVTLRPIDDSLEAVIPVGCSLEQAVNYQTDRRILVSGAIWRLLSPTQRAALLVHEAVYRELRDHGESDSRRARHFTAHLFAGGRYEPFGDEPGFEPVGFCAEVGSPDRPGRTSVSYLVGSTQPRGRFVFHELGGRLLLSVARFDVALAPREDPRSVFDNLVRPPLYWTSMERALSSLFESGDEVQIMAMQHGVYGPRVEVRGRSAADGRRFGPIVLRCSGTGTTPPAASTPPASTPDHPADPSR